MESNSPSSQSTAFLGRDRLFPLLLKLGIPAAVAMLVSALYNIVDAIFVGHGVGPLAIAALAIVFPIQMVVSALAQGIGVGAASIVSRRLGEKRERDAAQTIGTAYATVLVTNVILVVLTYVFMRPILAFFGATEGIMPYALQYMGAITPGFFFAAASMAANSLVRAEGNAKASMTGMLLGALLNCALAPLFIFGFHLGVTGAGIATMLSQIASAAYLFSLYFRKKTHVALVRDDFRIRPAILRESAILGTPAFIQAAGMSLLALVINNSLVFHGGDQAITIYGMINRFTMLVIFPILGIAQGFQPIAGYNYGAHNYQRVKGALKVAILTVLGIASVCYGVIMVFPQACLGLFTSEADLVGIGARVIRIVALFIPLAAVQIIGSTYFQAVGRRTQALILGLSRQFLILIPLVLILPLFLGLEGIWWSFPAADLIATSLTVTLLVRELGHLEDRQSDHDAQSPGTAGA